MLLYEKVGIAAVAMQFQDGRVVAGEPGQFHHDLIDTYSDVSGDDCDEIIASIDTQGFITTKGEYLDRKQASRRTRHGNGWLMAEDIDLAEYH
jgi:hypothetical protein